ncbi:MAG: pantoate--beta-alanine ligase [Crocinitomicaceae bacterium]|nr:pantoate--beta-alanine ligase [Crocinitomicaceae bacterium]
MPLQLHTTIVSLNNWLSQVKKRDASIGFVPTMGALHEGHISLIRQAKKENSVVMASIFVNPTQFNNSEDFLHYPRTEAKDRDMLSEAGCDAVFIPDVSQMYPDNEKGHWNFGLLSSVLEGYYRPGHFDGVLTIVKKLFDLVRPTRAYFGEKDFQQLAHIRRLVQVEKMAVEIVSCPTLREPGGLAMSSRNRRLKPAEYAAALHISSVLFGMKKMKEELSPAELEIWGRKELEKISGLRMEYLEIVDPSTFAPLAEWEDAPNAIALTAVYAGEVRLIDNLMLSGY